MPISSQVMNRFGNADSKSRNRKTTILFKCTRRSAIMGLLAFSVKAMDAIIIVIATMDIVACTQSAKNVLNHHISQKWIISSVTRSMGYPITELRPQHRPSQHQMQQVFPEVMPRKLQPDQHNKRRLWEEEQPQNRP